MHPKIAIRKQLDAAEATVKGLADVEQALKRLERKVDALKRTIKKFEVAEE